MRKSVDEKAIQRLDLQMKRASYIADREEAVVNEAIDRESAKRWHEAGNDVRNIEHRDKANAALKEIKRLDALIAETK